TLERPALQRLFADIAQHRVDTVVVYKVDRLTRSLRESSCDRRRTTAPRTDRPSSDQDRRPSDRVGGTEAAAGPPLTEPVRPKPNRRFLNGDDTPVRARNVPQGTSPVRLHAREGRETPGLGLAGSAFLAALAEHEQLPWVC